MRVLIVAEYYPRAGDPVLGIWTHRQAVAARQAGAEVRVLALHRPLPPLSALRAGERQRALAPLRQPSRAVLDEVRADYVRYLSPPRPLSYQDWGRWAARSLARALGRVQREFPFELIHAHYAVPAGDAVRRAAPDAPLVLSIHGHDVQGRSAGGPNVRAAIAHARLVLANSRGTARRCQALGARATRVVHLGTDVAEPAGRPRRPHTLVTVAHLGARKRHRDVIEALALLPSALADVRYLIVGDGPQRRQLEAQARSLGLADRVRFGGQLDHAGALAAARSASLFVMPSVDEAFGVAYVEAMIAGVPALGCLGEDGPEEIAACGPGIALVPPQDPAALAARIAELLGSAGKHAALANAARQTALRHFTWERCGRETVKAYAIALERDRP